MKPHRHRHSIVAAVSLCACVGGCNTDGAAPRATGGPATPTAAATIGEAFHDAEAVAAREPGRVTAKGTGGSMAPVYGDNTLLVINPIRYEDLQPGMTVAYVNSAGVRVVHKLVSRVRDGWFVAGINNDRVDEDMVTERNLLGVVYATFHYTDEP